MFQFRYFKNNGSGKELIFAATFFCYFLKLIFENLTTATLS